MSYAQFVKMHFHDAEYKGMKPQQVMQKLGAKWRSMHGETAKKKAATKGGAVSAAGLKTKGGKKAKGAGIVGDVIGHLLPF